MTTAISEVETKAALNYIRSFFDYIIQMKTIDSRSEWTQGIQRSLSVLESKIKMLEADNNVLNARNVKLEGEIQELTKTNVGLDVQTKSSKVNIAEQQSIYGTVDTKKILPHCDEKEVKVKGMKSADDAMKVEHVHSNTVLNESQKTVKCILDNIGAKLLVFYESSDYSPIDSRHELQHRGEYPGSKPYIKCIIPGIREGWASFASVRDALKRLFTQPGAWLHNSIDIGRINQWRCSVGGKEAAATTSHDDKWEKEAERTQFCSSNGLQFSWEEAGKPREWVDIRHGDSILVCGGHRRTVLVILPY